MSFDCILCDDIGVIVSKRIKRLHNLLDNKKKIQTK